jgi:hypothetical protein
VNGDDVVARAQARIDSVLWGRPEESFSARELLLMVDLPALINEVRRLTDALENALSEVAVLRTRASYD